MSCISNLEYMFSCTFINLFYKLYLNVSSAQFI